MLLTLTTTHRPATDLGFLLHKNPGRIHRDNLPYGEAVVFFPQADDERCTAALWYDIDPVRLTRGAGRDKGDFALRHYVNDRPYAASSFLSVAIARMYREAMKGRSKEREELSQLQIPLAAHIPAVPCRGAPDLLRRLFEPLGYLVDAKRLPLDPKFPDWGESNYYELTLTATCKLSDLLSHLYVLLPVLDDEKHYWVGDAEVEKLLERGGEWLKAHPERNLITRRYLAYQGGLTREALARLCEVTEDPDEEQAAHAAEETKIEQTVAVEAPAVPAPVEEKPEPPLNAVRMEAVLRELKSVNAKRVIDLGCGEGRLIAHMVREPFDEIVGVDVSIRALEIARDRLRLDRTNARRERVKLLQGALTYRDDRLKGYDAAACVEVIEHLDPPRLASFERVVFEFARPGRVVITTPNVEYNTKFESLPVGKLRHRDHRFEWTRAEFEAWAGGVAQRRGYTVHYAAIGPVDENLGPPTQMAVFDRTGAA